MTKADACCTPKCQKSTNTSKEWKMTSLTGTEELTEPLSAEGIARSTVAGAPLGADELNRIDAFWRACKYLALGMIYLQANPLLREPLKPEHIKSRLLGHWGSSPGLAFIYTHLSRLIKRDDLEMIFLAGPGHGAPGVLAPIYLEGTYSEIYPEKSEDEKGLREFFKQFSFPGGIGSHCTPETPGSIHEGGELGYVLSHACGAAFDNPDLIVAAVVGDGEAETGPLATSWHISKFLNPIRDGAVLPILHLNGYKINNPTLLARITHEELEDLLRGYGWNPSFVEGSDPDSMHQAMAATLEQCIEEIKGHQQECRKSGLATRPRWPMVVLRSPKGWSAPTLVDGHHIEAFWRSHQVPLTDVETNPAHLRLLETWLRSLKPEEFFDECGRVRPEIAAFAPKGQRRMSASPHANAELRKKLRLPEFCDYAVKVDRPGNTEVENVPPLGRFLRDVMKWNRDSFRVFAPDENTSNKLDATYEAFVHVIDSMFNQHAKWLSICNQLSWRRKIASLNLLITSTVWRQDHNGFTHQDPGFLDVVLNKSAAVTRIYLPPDANCLLSVADHCLRSENYINVIVSDKQRHLQYLDMDAAVTHCTKGIGIWNWASNDEGQEPDVVFAAAGDIPTQEALAATALLRDRFPDLKIRFITVVDLFKLQPHNEHPHGLTDGDFDSLFTTDKPIIFNFHGYPWLIHRLASRRPNHPNMHVGGS